MPSIKGKPKEQISYKCPHDILQKITAVIENGEYASRNDVLTAALILFFKDHNTRCKEQVIEWLTSEYGEQWMQNQIRIVLDDNGLKTKQ
jgi:Arc/MetJ-type ribon-helix-helix transcriptional regulator